jgi:iron complex transport system substrate-binding protein
VRIVSLLPSATELLFAVGAGDDVVGVTFECDYPAAARNRTIVSDSALPAGLSAAGIDAAVTERLAAGADLYHLHERALAELAPDLVVTQDLCAVCAVDVSVVDEALDYLGCTADVLTLDPQTLDEVIASIGTVGDAVGRVGESAALQRNLHDRLDAVRDAVAGRPTVATLVLEWTDPPFAPGHWVPDMVTTAGGDCVLGKSGERSYRTDWESVRTAGAEVIVAAPCGYGLAESSALAADLPPLGVPVWAVDANASFARPGPRLVDGVEALAGILHPDLPLDSALARRIRPSTVE